VISALDWIVIVPPYRGVPRLSHQFPVEDVVVAVAAVVVVLVGVDAVIAVVDVVMIDVVVVLVVDVVVDVVVAELQDDNTTDITTRLVSSIQKNPFFISTSCINNTFIDKTKAGRVTNPDYSQGSITGGANNYT
jgi:hypothetical protein